MGTTVQVLDVDELAKQRIGMMNASLTDWSATTVSDYSAGSWFTSSGSVYYCTSDELMGTAAQWAGIGNSNTVFSYHNPSTLLFYWSTTAPEWDDAKQEWVLGASPTHRCLASVYKDSSGLCTQKTIFLNREQGITYQGLNLGGQGANADHIVRFASDCSILWDESDDQIKITDKTTVPTEIASYSYGDVLIASTTSAYDFYLKKPISAWFKHTNPVLYDSKEFRLYRWDNGTYRLTITLDNNAGANTTTYWYGYNLNPGKYRVEAEQGTSYVYASGVYGSDAMTLSRIITAV